VFCQRNTILMDPGLSRATGHGGRANRKGTRTIAIKAQKGKDEKI